MTFLKTISAGLIWFAACNPAFAQQFNPKNSGFGASEAKAAMARCGKGAGRYSAESGGEELKINVKYSGSDPIYIRWIDFDGNLDQRDGESSAAKIAKGGRYKQSSYAGHYFMVSRDWKGRSCLAILDARELANLNSFGF